MKKKTSKSHRFKKGESGNKRGRPKGSRDKLNRELHAILDNIVDFDKLIKALARKAYRGNHHCAKILLEHRYGKPAQKVGFDIPPGRVIVEFTDAE